MDEAINVNTKRVLRSKYPRDKQSVICLGVVAREISTKLA
jgi:hypothetical protein